MCAHTGKDLRRIVMVGGGAQNALLRRLTAERTGMPVRSGPAESSTIGNLAVQCAVRYGGTDDRSDGFAGLVAQWAWHLAQAGHHCA